MDKKDHNEELTAKAKEQRRAKIQASFEKAAELNAKALEKLSDDSQKS